MRDLGERRRHGHGGHVNVVGFGAGAGGGQHAEHDQEKQKEKKLDMSGMSMDTLPHITMSLGHITTLDLSNNNLEVGFSSCLCYNDLLFPSNQFFGSFFCSNVK